MYNSRNKISTKLNDTFRLKINIKAKKGMFSCKPAYPLPQKALSIHFDHNYLVWYKTYS